MQSNHDREDGRGTDSNPTASEQPRTFQMLGRLFLNRQQSRRRQQSDSQQEGNVTNYQTSNPGMSMPPPAVSLFAAESANKAQVEGLGISVPISTNQPFTINTPTVNIASPRSQQDEGTSNISGHAPEPSTPGLFGFPPIPKPPNNPTTTLPRSKSGNLSPPSTMQNGPLGNLDTIRDSSMFFDTAISTFGLQPQLGNQATTGAINSPHTPLMTPVTLPRHLRQPSLPPPSGPLPRPPSRLENERIGARLSASSPGMGSSIRSRLNAYPFPYIPETQGSSGTPEFGTDGVTLIGPTNNSQRTKLSQNTFESPYESASRNQRLPMSHNQLSPANLSPINGSSPGSMGRQPSAHTQASSDALGENSRPSVAYEGQPVPGTSSQFLAVGNRKTDASDYSVLSASFFEMYTNRESTDLLQDQAAPKPLKPMQETQDFLARPKENSEDHVSSGSSEAIVKLSSNRSSSKSDFSNRGSRSMSRLSGLSFVSGAAFMISEEAGNNSSNSGISYRVENVSPDLGGLMTASGDLQKGKDLQETGPESQSRDLRSSVRVHPADDRFEHTYRMRRASEAEDPILVPVYNFEPPGNFPDRSRATAPRTTPRFVNHTPRNFSLPGRAVTKPNGRSSSDSAEMLLPDNDYYDSMDSELSPPMAAYGTNMHSARSPRFSINRLSQKPVSTRQNISTIEKPQSPRNSTAFQKETAQQRFENQHGHYFHDLDHLEKAHRPNAPVPPQVQIHGPRHSFSAKYGAPTLNRAGEAYVGDTIDVSRWPERYKRQKRIGRSLLCVCLILPPLWLIMAVGLLDNLVSEMTNGEIWSVGHTEKSIAAWLGGLFCFVLVVAVITLGIVVL